MEFIVEEKRKFDFKNGESTTVWNHECDTVTFNPTITVSKLCLLTQSTNIFNFNNTNFDVFLSFQLTIFYYSPRSFQSEHMECKCQPFLIKKIIRTNQIQMSIVQCRSNSTVYECLSVCAVII